MGIATPAAESTLGCTYAPHYLRSRQQAAS
jgi:hypothetical protein